MPRKPQLPQLKTPDRPANVEKQAILSGLRVQGSGRLKRGNQTREAISRDIRVRGAREHNLKNIDVDIPRNKLVVFTGVSGSGKSSLAFGTLYAEAQRRYLESVSPYARRLFHQLKTPEVDSIEGLPPAVALQQQRGTPTTRSSVGSVTTLSNLLRILYSRAGDYPPRQPMLYAESFSPNRIEGACPICHGLGRVYEVTEKSMVPDGSLTIRERAIAAWPTAWQGQNLRDILVTLGYDIDTPWRKLSKKDRDWILFTEEQPTVPVYAGFTPAETKRALRQKMEPSYMGTFTGARRYVMHTFSNSQSAMMKKRVSAYLLSAECSGCHGKRLRADALNIKIDDLDIAEMSSLPLAKVRSLFQDMQRKRHGMDDQEKATVRQRVGSEILSRLAVLEDIGLGYLSVDRQTPTLSPGELQRLRLATQIQSNLFGVVYVLDEPSAGLHPHDTQALLRALDLLKQSGNSLFVVEHEMDVVRDADWIVDIGPGAGERGGEVLYCGPPEGLRGIPRSETGRFLFAELSESKHIPRTPKHWITLHNLHRNNLKDLEVSIPLGVLTAVTGVSGSGKSTLISVALVDLISEKLGRLPAEERDPDSPATAREATVGHITGDIDRIRRLVCVDQKPIGRTPRSNMATYTGIFDHIRGLFASTELARSRKYDAGRFSFNVAKGRCERCQGEGFVCVELLFLPSVYSPCPVCHGDRFNEATLEVLYRGSNIAGILAMTVDRAREFFTEDIGLRHSLTVLQEVGLGYLRLGQPATELSGGEAQRIKLATELQRAGRADTLYVLDEPTTGLHPADVERLLRQIQILADLGNTVIVVEHDIDVIVASDWVIDMGPGAGEEGGQVVVAGPPLAVARHSMSKTGIYLKKRLLGRAR